MTELADSPGTAQHAPARGERGLTAGLRRARTPLLVGAGVAAMSLALNLRDPHESGSWGFCPSTVLFDLYCPGCGGLRAVNHLTHAELLPAASSNLFFVALVPVLVLGWLWWTVRAARGRDTTVRLLSSTPFLSVFFGLLLIFTVLRNLPVGQWLAP